MKRVVWSLVILLAVLLGPAEATTPFFTKDQMEIGLITGAGRGVVASREENLTLSETMLRYGRYSAPLELGILSGNAGWVVEGIALVNATNPSAYGAGIAFVPRYVLAGSRFRPLVTAGLGAIWTSKKMPSGTSDFNFRSHFGLGFKYVWNEDWGLDVEARFHHISNNGLHTPNPGINSLELLLGFYLTP